MRYAISIVLGKNVAKIIFFFTGYFEDIRYEIPSNPRESDFNRRMLPRVTKGPTLLNKWTSDSGMKKLSLDRIYNKIEHM